MYKRIINKNVIIRSRFGKASCYVTVWTNLVSRIRILTKFVNVFQAQIIRILTVGRTWKIRISELWIVTVFELELLKFTIYNMSMGKRLGMEVK